MFETLKIVVKPCGAGYDAFIADNEGGEGPLYPGGSPDEALGHLIRESDLSGVFDKPVRLDITIESE